jgi:lysophospholipase L1-like esterase
MKQRLNRLLITIVLLSFSISSFGQWQVSSPIRFLALGDSYTIGQGVAPFERWPVQLMDSLVQRGYVNDTMGIIATTGWRTDQLLNAIQGQDLENRSFNMVSVLIGVNDQYQNRPFVQYQPKLKDILDSALRFVGYDASKVFVLSIPDYAYTPFGQQGNPFIISQQIDAYNSVKQAVCDSLGISFFPITDISREGLNDPSLVASDLLHPSGKQYSLWVNRILHYVDSMSSLSTQEIPFTRSFHLNQTSDSWEVCASLSRLEANRIILWSMDGKLIRNIDWIPGMLCMKISYESLKDSAYILGVESSNGLIWRRRLIHP